MFHQTLREHDGGRRDNERGPAFTAVLRRKGGGRSSVHFNGLSGPQKSIFWADAVWRIDLDMCCLYGIFFAQRQDTANPAQSRRLWKRFGDYLRQIQGQSVGSISNRPAPPLHHRLAPVGACFAPPVSSTIGTDQTPRSFFSLGRDPPLFSSLPGLCKWTKVSVLVSEWSNVSVVKEWPKFSNTFSELYLYFCPKVQI